MSDLATVFLRAADLVEAGWTQGAAARDAAGLQRNRVDDPAACKWCMGGAIERALLDLNVAGELYDGPGDTGLYEDVVAKLGGLDAVIRFNDAKDRAVEEVAAALRACAQ